MPLLRRLRSALVVLTLPLVMADAGPRCGGSSPRREPADDASHLEAPHPGTRHAAASVVAPPGARVTGAELGA